VFGVPVVHEDDALRAVRAAAELAERDLGAELMVRIGISTGEVASGGPASGRDLVTGEAVIVGKRLEEAAGAGEILLGEETHALVAHAVEAVPLAPFEVKGIRRPLTAFRLQAIKAGVPALPRRDDAPLVNRERELSRLLAVYDDVAGGRGARLLTLVGDAGIGKSRLARELLARAGKDASVHVGHCPPYGEGITFRPLQGLLSAAELSGSSHEIFATTRHVLVRLAEQRPVVAAFEDVHWAEPTFLDLIEYLAGRLGETRVLLLCLTRPDLAERRPAWLRDAIALEPLSEAESVQLLDELGVSDELRSRIAEAAEGNPLFVEQLAAIAETSTPLPASIRGVLSERIDQLGSNERAILQCAAVVGRDFALSAVADLTPPDLADRLEPYLLELARKGLVRPDPASPDEGYRFQHALIREATYETTPHAIRAAHHERVAGRLEAAGADPALVGHHFERAFLSLAALGPVGAEASALADRAAEQLELAGRQALGRSDLPAAIGLLERAGAVLPERDQRRVALLPDLAGALIEAGRLVEADAVLAEGSLLAGATQDERVEARVLVQQQLLQLQRVAAGSHDVAGLIRRVAPVFERHGDDRGLCSAHKLEAWTLWNEAQATAAAEAWEEAAACARRAGDDHELREILSWIASSFFFGPTPVAAGIARCQEIRAQVSGARGPEAATLRPLAGLHAMEGRFELARELLATSAGVFDDLGLTLNSAVSHHEAVVEMLARDFTAAEARLRAGFRALEEMGERALLSTTAAFLAQVILAQGRDAEAERFSRLSEELAASRDVLTQVMWRSVRARLLARGGRVEEAESLIRAAIALADDTDFLNQQGDACSDLAAILEDAGRPDEAREAASRSLQLYEQKGNRVAAGHARSRLAELV
jgi:predicted ATPase